LVLFTCKAYDLDSAMDAIAPAMKGATVVVPMLNGMAHMERLDKRFGAANVMGGACQINAMLKPDGTVYHGDPLQRLIYGERDKSKSPRALAFEAALAKSTIDGVLSPDIQLEMWEKITFLCALASTTCLFRGNVGEIVNAPGGPEIMKRAIAANAEIATREGFAPRPAFIERASPRLLDPTGNWSASMLRDLEGGGQVEADHIVGWMLERARKHGVDDTILSLAYTHLKTYENRRAAKRI
jgi:2-dehydropantoate 2-reductase